jgi:hypothetical protein
MRPKNPKPQFKIRLDKLVWETFKLECRRRGLKPNEVVENLIEIYLANPIITTLFAKG